MKILPIGHTNIQKANKLNSSRQNLYTKPLQFDSIHFGNIQKPNSAVEQATKLSRQIYDELIHNPKCNVESIIKSQSPDISIKPMKEIYEDNPYFVDCKAYYYCKYDDDFQPEEQIIYINDKPFSGNNIKNLIYSMDIAHEYTHYLQIKNGLSSIMNSFSSNTNYNLLVKFMAEQIFKPTEQRLLANMVMPSIGKNNNEIMYVLYGGTVPIEIEGIDKKQFFKNSKTSEKRFNKQIQNYFDLAFDRFLEQSKKYKGNSEIINLAKTIETEEQKEKLKSDVRKFIIFLTNMEKEARQSECNLADNILETNTHHLNIEAFVLFYKALGTAFSN